MESSVHRNALCQWCEGWVTLRTKGLGSRNLGSKPSLNGPSCRTQNWTQAWSLVSQTRWSFILSWDQQDLEGK